MSDSPQSPSKDVDHGAQSPDEEQMNDPSDPHSGGLSGYELAEGVKEQDRWLPIANVARIMKNALPENAKIAKEAKECMQECVSEFISFITSEASEKCQAEKRKTVNGEDILYAMTSLGFENYSEALKVYLTKYREQQNQSNRDRAMDHGWTHSMMPGENAGVEGSKTGGDGGYMYSTESAHNGPGTGPAEGY